VAAALALMKGALPDVIISDIGMPGEDGIDFIRKVRQLPPEFGGKIPAVALTAYARAEDRLRVLRAGYQMYLAKPVELAELAAIVSTLAGRTLGH
jgi:CheY-like chemotaxis protein